MSNTFANPYIDDRRRSPRHKCLRMARCMFNHEQSDLEVMLRNISDTGARITGDELICLPEQFELHIHDGFGGFDVRKVRRVWMTGNAAGLEFLP
jgi:hypothetical protein